MRPDLTTRRDFAVALAALASLPTVAQAQQGTGSLATPHVFTPQLNTLPNGSQRWADPGGTLATGEAVAIHVSVIPPATPKGTLHVIHHSEFLVILEGNVHYQHGDTVEQASAGSILYVANQTSHLVWNEASTPAKYVVIQIGGDRSRPRTCK
jgi:mannose-6-phosphate isomerase-like protein (cupin superfamily)